METRRKVALAVVALALTVSGMVMFALAQGTGGMMSRSVSGMMGSQDRAGTQTPAGPGCRTGNVQCTEGGVCRDRCTGGGNADDGGSYKCPDLDSKGSCAMESTGGSSPCPGSRTSGTARMMGGMMSGACSPADAASCHRASI